MLIMRRIMDRVDVELKRRGLDRQLHSTLRTLTQVELKLVDEELNSIMADMADRSSIGSSVSSNSSSFSSSFIAGGVDEDPAQEMLRIYRERDGFRFANLRRVSRFAESSAGSVEATEATMASLPKVLARKLLGPLANLMQLFQRSRRQSLFSADPVHYLKDRAMKILGVMSTKSEFFVQMTSKYHEKLDTFITDVDNSIPR